MILFCLGYRSTPILLSNPREKNKFAALFPNGKILQVINDGIPPTYTIILSDGEALIENAIEMLECLNRQVPYELIDEKKPYLER